MEDSNVGTEFHKTFLQRVKHLYFYHYRISNGEMSVYLALQELC